MSGSAIHSGVIYLTTGPFRVTLECNVENYLNKSSPKRTIDLENIHEFNRLSIVGDIYRGGRMESCGQVYDAVRALFKDNVSIQMICDIWQRWHLNDLKAGTREQNAVIDKVFSDEHRYNYDEACEVLKEKNLYVDRGYKYGSEWLVEPLPQDIINKVRELFPSVSA
jgi:hypothetical protein